jgi:hypothetical protein
MEEGFTENGLKRRTVQRKDFKTILKNKTFIFIVMQGVFGSIPTAGIMFLPTWIEYMGFQPLVASGLFVIVAFSAGAGYVFGGWFGDHMAKKSPNRGRIMVAQLSVGGAIPLELLLFLGFNLSARPVPLASIIGMLVVGMIVGFWCSWAGNGCNNPIFSEIFEPEIRGSAFAVDRVFEGSIASFGTLFISLVATAFHFVTPPPTFSTLYPQGPNQYPDWFALPNLHSLTLAMIIIMTIPQATCLALYTLVYFTYPADLKRAKAIMAARAAAEKEPEESPNGA